MQTKQKAHPLRLEKPMRITEQAWPEGTEPVVSVFSWAYNHVEFIRESIDSILMQETTFPVEIIIHDDASTDGTTEIIREYEAQYPHLFRNIIQNKNQWSQGKSVMSPLRFAPRGDYIALSHGDDFWVSHDKLERQIAVFRNHPNILFCGGACNVLDSATGEIMEVSPPETQCLQTIKARDHFPGCSLSPWIHTCTRVFPRGILRTLPEEFGIDTLMLHWLLTEYPMHEIVVLPEVVATYRVHKGGTWTGMDQCSKNRTLVDIYTKAARLYEGNKKLILLKRAIESAQLLCAPGALPLTRQLYWKLNLWYLRHFARRYADRIQAIKAAVS